MRNSLEATLLCFVASKLMAQYFKSFAFVHCIPYGIKHTLGFCTAFSFVLCGEHTHTETHIHQLVPWRVTDARIIIHYF